MRRHLLVATTFAVAALTLVGGTDAGRAVETGTVTGVASGGAGPAGAPRGEVEPVAVKRTTVEPEPERAVATTSMPTGPVVLAQDEPVALALETSRALFTAAPAVVLATPETALRAASVAVALGVPVILDGPGAEEEIARLGAGTVLTAGPATTPATPLPADDDELRDALDGRLGAVQAVADGAGVAAVAGLALEEPALLGPADQAAAPPGEEPPSDDATEPADDGPAARVAAVLAAADILRPARPFAPPAGPRTLAALPDVARPAQPGASVVVMSTGEPGQVAAAATARAAGATVQLVPAGDPRASSTTVQETAAHAPDVVVGLGTAFGDAATLGWRTATAATGTELPGGGQLVLPGKTYVALYGAVGSGALGVLGEQDAPATVARARQHADGYEGLTGTTVVPALEIIATVASRGAGDDGDYSAEMGVEILRPLVDLAHDNGQYVVLDLQPGRTDFLTQAKRYEELLRLPNVGLALDPEWRLAPDQQHLRQVGQVDVSEVNQVVTWLADLTREHHLPQKLLVLHQFQLRMVTGADGVDQSRSEVAVLVHVDGQGSQPAKQGTWAALHAGQPSIRWWGWKNFYDEDTPMLSPAETVAVAPMPNLISYQ